MHRSSLRYESIFYCRCRIDACIWCNNPDLQNRQAKGAEYPFRVLVDVKKVMLNNCVCALESFNRGRIPEMKYMT